MPSVVSSCGRFVIDTPSVVAEVVVLPGNHRFVVGDVVDGYTVLVGRQTVRNQIHNKVV